MKLYRPTLFGAWWLGSLASFIVGFLLNGGAVAPFPVVALTSALASMLIGYIFAPASWKLVTRKPRREPPNAIADMATFKASRRDREIAEWETEYCDALGFGKDEHWHRLSAVQHASRGETYHHVRRRA